MVGLRVQTTHVASIKRKYTVWGVSSQSAERREFDVEDETTGRRTKTNVAAYFRERYNIPLRYANSFYQAESTHCPFQLIRGMAAFCCHTGLRPLEEADSPLYP